MIDVLAGVLTGSPAGQGADAHGRIEGGVGHLVIALRTTLFVDAEAYAAGIELLLAGLRAQGTDDDPIVFPGDPELKARERAGRDGIPISSELADKTL